ncbi:MAG: BMP family ABC transporter substrate-binding protein [Candidatus Faecousia sp.]|nr:BMP family ABC transporter substrate-binding protein [Candidatus Faecousia sp.]
MKKILSLALVLVLVLSLSACGGKTETPAATAAETTAAAAEGETTAAAETEAPAALSNVKVGFIFLHDENSTYDLNFMNAAKEAIAALGLTEDQYMFRTNIPEGQECYNAACELADAGCNLIFADSFGHEDYMIQAAQEFPEVQFCHATGTKAHTQGLANFHNAFAAIYEGRYLAGVAAGMKLNQMIEDGTITADQAKMGYVGAYTYAEVVSGYTSFYLGAKSVCPSVTMDVTFTGSWYDETAEKEGANKLIGNGCVLLSQHADSMGAPTACETAGVPDVSYNGSTVAACPNTYLISSRINWAPYFELIVNAVANGTEIPADWTGTIETGSVVLTDLNDAVAAPGTAEKMDEVKAGLEDGSVKVFDTTTFTVKGEEISSYMADVDTDPAYTPDTEVVENGAFQESAKRSAPYFDLQIDGINLLDTAF